jgi:hypothetical protein
MGALWEEAMTQKRFFEMLGAPLANARWSWGAVRESDGAVLLRVWRDQIRTHGGKQLVQLLRQVSKAPGSQERGLRERIEHVERIRSGARCLLVICEVEDAAARPRRVKHFNAKELFPGGPLKEIDGDVWVELLPAVPVEELMSSQGTGTDHGAA